MQYVDLDLQFPCGTDIELPMSADINTWVSECLRTALSQPPDHPLELTIRFSNADEIQQLNQEYRGKDKPTNVLSFPYEAMPGIHVPLLGDIIICPEVVKAEAEQQDKLLNHHYAHMVIHGILHLLGYDHMEDTEAKEMETLEVEILSNLGIDDPYRDHQ